jgi:iron complex transport system ATP-binding protein
MTALQTTALQTTALHTDRLSIDLSGTRIVSDVSIEITTGEFVGLVGPNGSGKTTLLRSLHRALRPVAGTVLVGSDNLWNIHALEAARRIAVVAQENQIGFDFTASEVAAMGRIPYKTGFERDTDEDRQLVAQSLTELGLAPLAHRSFDAMSGGERQRTLIARALVQQAPILLLDEPTNHLDIHYQLDVLHRVHSLKLTTIAALHDLNLAASWCDRVYVMDRGRIVAGGPPHESLTAERISSVFRVRATAFTHPITGKHQLLFDRASL